MTALDRKFRSLATRLIAKNGKGVTYTSISNGSYNAADGSVTNTETPITVKAIIEDLGSQSGKESWQIQAGDKKFTIAAESLQNPKRGDKITLNSVVYGVENIRETWSGEQIAMYEIHGRT